MKVLIVDDNRSSADAMARALKQAGHTTQSVYGGQQAIDAMSEEPFDVVLTDLKMEPVDGMEVLRHARTLTPPPHMFVFTAYGDMETAVEAMRLGAKDFLTKPVTLEQLMRRFEDLQRGALHGPATVPGTVATTADAPEDALTAISESARTLQQTLTNVASVPSHVWIEGEIGSGRGHAALTLHRLSEQRDLPFVVYNPWTDTTLPSQGTLFIHQVDDLPLDRQRALLQLLDTASPQLRLICSAAPDARSHVTEGTLLEALYYKLAVVQIAVPPLRARREDIIPMLQAQLQYFAERFEREVPEIRPSQEKRLLHHAWPGNLRELRNLAERVVVMGNSALDMRVIKPAADGLPTLDVGFSLSGYLENIERRLLIQALRQSGGDRTAAGRLLGVERNTLRYKLNKYDLLRTTNSR